MDLWINLARHWLLHENFSELLRNSPHHIAALTKSIERSGCLLCLCFIFLFTRGAGQSKPASKDSLQTLVIENAISDSLLIEAFCLDPADSFASTIFTPLKGITTFRGGPFRDRASYGSLAKRPDSMVVKWSFKTKPTGSWGGGAGWTGQPALVEWPDSLVAIMNVKETFRKRGSFREVIFGSLDGHVYFLDLETGSQSRDPINIKNPIKGSVSVDPRGLPLLYVGQGINVEKQFGFRIFNLQDQSLLHFINGRDTFAFRSWAAFDGAALVNPKTDRMYIGGENGLVYSVKLNTRWDTTTNCIAISPQVLKYRYKAGASHEQGIENSVAAFENLIYFADNHGYIQCLDLQTMKPKWVIKNHDDTDATIVVKPECGIPFIYTGNEVDKQGKKGFTWIKKLNGLTGETVWEKQYACLTVLGSRPVNGGMLSTPIIGKHKAADLVIFNLSRYGGLNKGLLVALNQKTGETIFEVALDNYAWSSPVDLYDTGGNLYIFLGDSQGYAMLFDGANGRLIHKIKLADLIEASPVAFDNMVVIPSRPNKIFCIEIR